MGCQVLPPTDSRHRSMGYEWGQHRVVPALEWRAPFPTKERWDEAGEHGQPKAAIPEEPAYVLEQAIARSAELLDDDRERDPDEAPASSIVARDRAIAFLRAHAAAAVRKHGMSLPVPRITGGPEGGIDLHWKLARGFELLVNFPAQADRPATFYGDNEGQDSIRGTFGTESESLKLLSWLVQTT